MNKFNNAIADFLLHKTTQVLKVCGNSMHPFLVNGQEASIISLQSPLKCGKCYIYISGNSLYVHRLVKAKNNTLFFVGDGAQKLEEIPADAVIAELNYKQDAFIIFILRYINLIFIKISRVFPQFIRLRKKVVSAVIKLERLLYERGI